MVSLMFLVREHCRRCFFMKTGGHPKTAWPSAYDDDIVYAIVWVHPDGEKYKRRVRFRIMQSAQLVHARNIGGFSFIFSTGRLRPSSTMSSRVAIEVLSPKVPMVSCNMYHKVKVGPPQRKVLISWKLSGVRTLGNGMGYFSTGVNRQKVRFGLLLATWQTM